VGQPLKPAWLRYFDNGEGLMTTRAHFVLMVSIEHPRCAGRSMRLRRHAGARLAFQVVGSPHRRTMPDWRETSAPRSGLISNISFLREGLAMFAPAGSFGPQAIYE
jgi:hypothetical protein